MWTYSAFLKLFQAHRQLQPMYKLLHSNTHLKMARSTHNNMQENSIWMVEIHGHTMAHAKNGEPGKEKKVNFNIWLEWEHKLCTK